MSESGVMKVPELKFFQLAVDEDFLLETKISTGFFPEGKAAHCLDQAVPLLNVCPENQPGVFVPDDFDYFKPRVQGAEVSLDKQGNIISG